MSTRKELLEWCKKEGIRGCSSKTKKELANIVDERKRDSTPIVKPFLKWVGGKTQIIRRVLNVFPLEIKDYYEPFLGGGSILLGLLSLIEYGKIEVRGNIYASDLNEHLINLYKNVQNRASELVDEVDEIVKQYNAIQGNYVDRDAKTLEDSLTSKESYYFWIRRQFNECKRKNGVKSSAMLIFLNKTCFRGVYREGPNGFNVPFGNYKNPSIIDRHSILRISKLIQRVTFKKSSYVDAIKNIKEGDFVYLDPPYASSKKTSFVSYTYNGFTENDQLVLFEECHRLSNIGVNFVMSNADVPIVREHLSKYNVEEILCKRHINSKNPESLAKELMISNYNPIK